MKFLHYNGVSANRYFWRNQQQQEIDYIEDRDGVLHAFEFKWSTSGKTKIPAAFSKTYPDHTFKLIVPDQMDTFLQ